MTRSSENITSNLTIDAILQRVRAELAETAQPSVQLESNRRIHSQSSPSVPMVATPLDSDALELGRPFYSIEEFAALDDEAFLRNAYRVVLGREIDSVGSAYYLPALRRGHISVVRVLSALRRSHEGKQRKVRIRWLMPAAVLDRLASMPVVGKLFAPFISLIVRPTTNQRLSTLSVRQNEMIAAINLSLSAIAKNQIHINQRIDGTERDLENGLRDFVSASDNAQIASRSAVSAFADARTAMEGAEKALSEVKASRQMMAEQKVQLQRLIETARDGLSTTSTEQTPVEIIDNHALDSLYVAFENQFRGSTGEITERLKRYLPIFENNRLDHPDRVVLDIGCGRGEWLSLLKQKEILTGGVDLNSAMVAQARELGLDVYEADAIAYLRSVPDSSLAAITGFHIVEHLEFRTLVTLFGEAYRALAPGGVILFETPNPENLVVGACTFNYDPTHNKPLPPDLLRFIANASGYIDTRIIRTDLDCHLDETESGFAPSEVNDWFRQPADYAVYARKPVDAGQN